MEIEKNPAAGSRFRNDPFAPNSADQHGLNVDPFDLRPKPNPELFDMLAQLFDGGAGIK